MFSIFYISWLDQTFSNLRMDTFIPQVTPHHLSFFILVLVHDRVLVLLLVHVIGLAIVILFKCVDKLEYYCSCFLLVKLLFLLMLVFFFILCLIFYLFFDLFLLELLLLFMILCWFYVIVLFLNPSIYNNFLFFFLCKFSFIYYIYNTFLI